MTTPGINQLYPRLVVSDAAAAIEFYVVALGAEEVTRFTAPDGKIPHALLAIGGLPVSVKDEGHGDPAPTTLGGTPVQINLRVSDADAVAAAMVAAGAAVVYPVDDRPYGERDGRLTDPYGHLWVVSQPLTES
jgi:PhnB protein